MRLPTSRFRRYVALPLVAVFATLALSYVLLMALQLHSTWRAVKTLDRLEAMRIGNSEAELQHALEYCEKSDENQYGLFAAFWEMRVLFWIQRKLPDESALDFRMFLNRIGFRNWGMYVNTSTAEGKVRKLDVTVFVVGREQTFATGWKAAQQVSRVRLTDQPDADSLRTNIYFTNVTSIPGGEGILMEITPESSEKELRARHLNRRCMYSFRGCENLCELLPDLLPVLKERKRWSEESPGETPLLDCER